MQKNASGRWDKNLTYRKLIYASKFKYKVMWIKNAVSILDIFYAIMKYYHINI